MGEVAHEFASAWVGGDREQQVGDDRLHGLDSAAVSAASGSASVVSYLVSEHRG